MAVLLLHIAAYCKASSFQDVMAINVMLPMLICTKSSQLEMIQVFWVVALSSGVIYSDVSKECVSFMFMGQGVMTVKNGRYCGF